MIARQHTPADAGCWQKLDVRARFYVMLAAGLLAATFIVWMCGDARASALYLLFGLAAALCYE